MHEETGGPKNSHTTDADQNNRQAESKEYGEEIELQDETIRKILMMFDQQILCETFDEEDTVSELDGSPDFSQAFKDRMRTMVAEKFGQEAAEDFIDRTSYMYEEASPEVKTAERMSQNQCAELALEVLSDAEESTETEIISQFRKMSGRTGNFMKWLVRAAAVMLAVLTVFTVHKVGCVQAIGLPGVDLDLETAVEYSKIGSLKDVISQLEYTNYPQKLEQISIPAKVPDGFKELSREQASVFINIFYENSAKQWYQYQQTTVGSSSFIDTEEGDWEDVDVGQWTGAYNSKGDTGNLWWFDYNYAYQLQGDLSKEEMIEIAESLVREK